jgi:hypothetical protein
MQTRVLLVALLTAAGCWACSSTPGDAALRSSHPDAAAKLYQKGAEQGDATAAVKLGLLIEEQKVAGFGSAGDWYLKACGLGNVVGCHNAGAGYEYAKQGLPMNYGEAARVYRLAAERGYMPSQYNLGSLYANSYIRGDIEGLKWLLISRATAEKCIDRPGCKWTYDDPPGHTKRLIQRMSPSDVQTAEREAKAWSAQL